MEPLPNAHALVVGIDAYTGARRLPPTSDAQDVAALLVNPAACGYDPARVRLLYNEQATLAALRAELAALAGAVPADGSVLLFFSGHGARLAEGPLAGDYLLPVDADASSAEALAATGLPGRELVAAIGAIRAQRVVMVFDCCHAAGISVTRGLVPDEVAVPEPEPARSGLSAGLYDTLKAGRGRVVFASSRGDEPSHVRPGARNGIFTGHLLAGLRGGVASDDGYVRVFDLFEYVQPLVTADQPGQHPVFQAEIEENFALALCRGGAAQPAATDEQGYRYDAYISYVEKEPDATWVWGTLVPRLEAAGLRLAVSGDSEAPGVARVVNIERGITQSKRTVVLLSPAYLGDPMADFENTLAQTMSVTEGSYRLLPLKIAPFPEDDLPLRLRMLSALDLTRPPRPGRDPLDRLVEALRGPIPVA